jgi:hypothetical protein
LLNNSIVKVDTTDFTIQIDEALMDEVDKVFQEELVNNPNQ